MNTIKEISDQLNLTSDELLIFQPLTDKFHPMVWLQSVGQFLNQNEEAGTVPSSAGVKSVLFEMT